MKKLLALVMVLGIASLATAGISFMTTDVEIGAPGIVTITVMGTGTPDEAWISIDSGNAVFNYATGALGSAAGTGDAFVINDGGYGAAWLYFQNVAVPTPNSWVDGVLFTVDMDVTSDTAISLYGPDGVEVVDSATIAIVPEPATMALLGLGALVLRRKK